ncbi:MAG: hypothetical protein IIA70_07210 [Proteobacteria bacterium]|nr:hypothetical protein [Pseudomonadota bacterium]
MDKTLRNYKLMAEITPLQKVQFVLFGSRAYLALHLERSPLSLVLLKGDIAVFSESGSGWALGTSRRQWLVLAQRRNTANDRFPARPKGAKQMTQYGVTALNKGMPLSAVCVLSWVICLALNMAISR